MLTVQKHLKSIHEHLISAIESFGCPPRRDCWTKENGDCGETCVFEKTGFLERGGINFSSVHGHSLPQSASNLRHDLRDSQFFATGVSLVLHPFNPYVPTVHLNVRFFCAYPHHFVFDASSFDHPAVTWWVGGGMDMTPYYGFREDAHHFHRVCHDRLLPFGSSLYSQFKKNCDDYFFLKHRSEARGIGGIFFDDFNEGGIDVSLRLVDAVGRGFVDAYCPIVARRLDHVYGERERDFQLYRRGRYVEFNLLWDRGTAFGLHSNGRAESILVSMPPVAHWIYDWKPEANSPESVLYDVFLQPRDWLNDATS